MHLQLHLKDKKSGTVASTAQFQNKKEIISPQPSPLETGSLALSAHESPRSHHNLNSHHTPHHQRL